MVTEEELLQAKLEWEEELLQAKLEAYWEEEKELEENGYIDCGCGCDHDCCCDPEYYHGKLKRELEEKGLI